jgi:hypothetical protein
VEPVAGVHHQAAKAARHGCYGEAVWLISEGALIPTDEPTR